MTIADSRVVAWQWHTKGPQFCTPEDKADRLAAGDHFAKGYTIPLVHESLLAEAETERDRLTSCLSQANILIEQFERDWYMACDERDRNAAQRDALQSRLDAVVALADELAVLGQHTHAVADDYKAGQIAAFNQAYQRLRAALGGESPANDEVRK